MQPNTYTVKANTPAQRWGQEVMDLVIAEDHSDVEYTVFVTPKNIYEVSVLGGSEDSFVQQTAQQIFDNLRFQN